MEPKTPLCNHKSLMLSHSNIKSAAGRAKAISSRLLHTFTMANCQDRLQCIPNNLLFFREISAQLQSTELRNMLFYAWRGCSVTQFLMYLFPKIFRWLVVLPDTCFLLVCTFFSHRSFTKPSCKTNLQAFLLVSWIQNIKHDF